MKAGKSEYYLRVNTDAFGAGSTNIVYDGQWRVFCSEGFGGCAIDEDVIGYELEVSVAENRAFWEEACRLPKWEAEYAELVCDGMTWSAEIRAPNFYRKSKGHHKTPPGWERLRKAFEKLLGDDDFLF